MTPRGRAMAQHAETAETAEQIGMFSMAQERREAARDWTR